MQDLKGLHRQLGRLQRQRAVIRWATAAAAAVAAVLFLLAGLLLIDVTFETDVLQRLFLIGLAAVCLVAAVRRYAVPLGSRRESRVALALQVERHEGIDNDLVAAMQFEHPGGSASAGSQVLRQAVVADAIRRADRGPLRADHPVPAARRILLAWLLAVSVAAGIGLLWPEHVRVFARRMCLASPHYPTRSRIEQVEVDGTRVLVRSVHGAQPRGVTRPEGTPVRFRVWAAGRLPEGATLRLTTPDGRQRVIELEPLPPEDAGGGDPGGQPAGGGRCYAGLLPRLLEPARFQVFLGDAWTDPAPLRMVPLPAVAMNLSPVLPAYARGASPAGGDAQRQQVAVLEGSDVGLEVRCTNGKRLRSAELTVVSCNPPQRYALAPAGPAGDAWVLPAADSPLADIASEIRFQVQVVDHDGLSLEAPLAGLIQIQADRPPNCSASLVHRVVLPSAAPVIAYRAGDDYALGSLQLEIQLEPAEGGESGTLPAWSLPVRDDSGPWMQDRLPLDDSYRLELARLRAQAESRDADPLVKGDRLKLTLVAVDYRGARPGQRARSEPLVLEIGDEAGVLSAIAESDEQSERQLDALIKQQLGIGEE